MWGRINGRRVMALGTPGAMRNNLNSLVLAGRKTATAGLLAHDYDNENEVVEFVGEELVVVDDHDVQTALIAVDRVQVVPFAEVSWEFARAECEDFESIEDWRAGHMRYWRDQGVAVSDETSIVCLRFHLVDARQ